MNTQHKEIEAYTERHIDSFSIVLVNTLPTYENRFQRDVCDIMYGALHGLVFPTDDFNLLKRNVMKVLELIDKNNPRKDRQLRTSLIDFEVDRFDRERRVNTLAIGEVIQHEGVFRRICFVKFMPVQGIFVKTEVGEPKLFAAPFFQDRIMWAYSFNKYLEEEGGKQ